MVSFWYLDCCTKLFWKWESYQNCTALHQNSLGTCKSLQNPEMSWPLIIIGTRGASPCTVNFGGCKNRAFCDLVVRRRSSSFVWKFQFTQKCFFLYCSLFYYAPEWFKMQMFTARCSKMKFHCFKNWAVPPLLFIVMILRCAFLAFLCVAFFCTYL